MTNNPLDDLEASLTDSIGCDVKRQEWPRVLPDGTAGSWTPNIGLNGPCPHPAEAFVSWRACPCRSQAKRLQSQGFDISTIRVVRGLVLIGQFMCTWHLQHYTRDLPFPFMCPGCGIIYQQADDMVVDVAPISGV